MRHTLIPVLGMVVTLTSLVVMADEHPQKVYRGSPEVMEPETAITQGGGERGVGRNLCWMATTASGEDALEKALKPEGVTIWTWPIIGQSNIAAYCKTLCGVDQVHCAATCLKCINEYETERRRRAH